MVEPAHVGRAALVALGVDALLQRGVGHRDHAALARRQLLVGVEAERRRVAAARRPATPSACTAPSASQASSTIGRPRRLEGRQVGGVAEDVHRQQRRRAVGHRGRRRVRVEVERHAGRCRRTPAARARRRRRWRWRRTRTATSRPRRRRSRRPRAARGAARRCRSRPRSRAPRPGARRTPARTRARAARARAGPERRTSSTAAPPPRPGRAGRAGSRRARACSRRLRGGRARAGCIGRTPASRPAPATRPR